MRSRKFLRPERLGWLRRPCWFYYFKTWEHLLTRFILVTLRWLTWKFSSEGYWFINFMLLVQILYFEYPHYLFVIVHVIIKIFLCHRASNFIFEVFACWGNDLFGPLNLSLYLVFISRNHALTKLLPFLLLFDYEILVVFKLHLSFAVLKLGYLFVIYLQNLRGRLQPGNKCYTA